MRSDTETKRPAEEVLDVEKEELDELDEQELELEHEVASDEAAEDHSVGHDR